GHIHDYNVSVELRRGITCFMVWARRRMFELGGDHLAGSDRWLIAAASGLHVALEYFQSLLYTFSMGDSHAFVIANECGQRNRFRCAERRIPTCSVFTRCDFFAVVVHGLPRRNKPNELFTGARVLTGN